MKIEIPMLVPKETNPNWRGHWVQKYKATKSFRDAAHICYLADNRGEPPFFKKASLAITLIIPSRRYIRDPDNAIASLKPAIDGCVDAGVILGDDDEHLVYKLPIMYQIDKEKAPMTILEFEEVK